MKTFITLVVVALIVWGGYVLFRGAPDVAIPGTDDGAQTYLTPVTYQTPNPATSTSTSSPTVLPETKTFTVTGSNFSFSPKTMQVNRGDRVRIVFQNQSGTHDLVVDGYNTRTKVLQGGQSETLEFVANQSGSFEYYCSVGNHRQMGMKGTLTVN
jgi:plastocyanin